MPLPDPAPRKLMHTRAIECTGYERDDGLWDIEAHLTDTKTTAHTRHHGGRARRAGEPVHDLWIRVTIDLDMKIHEVEARRTRVPTPSAATLRPTSRPWRASPSVPAGVKRLPSASAA